MKKVNVLFCILTLISCTTKEIFMEDIPFLYGNNNAQPNLVSYDGTLSLSWISSEQDNNASLHFSQLKNGKWIKPQKKLLMALTGLLIGLIFQLMQLTRI